MKTIVILSTEPWGKMLLSKMHYAIELAAAGHRVYFVNPPRDTGQSSLIEEGTFVQGVQVLHMKPLKHALFLRHKLLPVYNLLMKRYAARIRSIAGNKIDELWNFNPNSFPGMEGFAAKKNILLLYDFYKGRHVEHAAKKAAILLTPSAIILEYYRPFFKEGYFLQHGLGANFVAHSKTRLASLSTGQKCSDIIRVGYTGNLLRQAMNTAIMQELISAHPAIEFHIWGPYSNEGNNVTDAKSPVPDRWQQFIRFLQNASNVFLHGVTEQAALAVAMQEMDAFLFVYSAETDMNAASNSHKLLEYISTGKTVISSFVSTYKSMGLLEMSENEQDLPQLFKTITGDINRYNAVDKQEERIQYALNNSYAAQIGKINRYLYPS